MLNGDCYIRLCIAIKLIPVRYVVKYPLINPQPDKYVGTEFRAVEQYISNGSNRLRSRNDRILYPCNIDRSPKQIA